MVASGRRDWGPIPERTPRSVRIARAFVLGAIAATVAGCGAYFPGPWRLFDGPDEGFPETVAEYSRGTATLVLTGGTNARVELELATGELVSSIGSQVYWSNDDGWGLGLMGYGEEAGWPGSGSLQIDRAIRGHWAAHDWMGACDVEIAREDERGFRGTATCEGLRWTDAMAGMYVMAEPPFIEGQEPFDAEVRFEALP